jgi:hypothetical protein
MSRLIMQYDVDQVGLEVRVFVRDEQPRTEIVSANCRAARHYDMRDPATLRLR